MLRTLPGQELQDQDYEELRKLVDRLIFDLIFKPVVALVRPTLPRPLAASIAPATLKSASHAELVNALDKEGQAALARALRTGGVQAVPDPKGVKAQFAVAKADRRISDGLKSFGCKLNGTTGLWECAPDQVPNWVRVEVSSYQAKARAIHDQVAKLLDGIETQIDEVVDDANFAKGVDHAIGEVAKGWKESAKALEVVPDLGERGLAELREGFDRNARIPIKRMAKETIARLRAEVDENAMRGYRAEGLASRIRDEYGVSKTRADLIARQETSNFMAAYRAARATDAGLKRYVWTAVRDPRTRPLHKKLNGQIFYYNKPPIIDEHTGQRGNPGQTFRCRCVDRPVIE